MIFVLTESITNLDGEGRRLHIREGGRKNQKIFFQAKSEECSAEFVEFANIDVEIS